MQPEKRKYARTDIFLIIHFRLIHNLYAYELGTSRNYSDDGLSLESHNFECKPGQVLECTIKHPGSNTSVSILGKIVWKKDGWYDAVMGMKFLHMDEKNIRAIRDLAGALINKSMPVLSEDTALGTTHDPPTQNMIKQNTSSEETDTPAPPLRARPSTKRRQTYIWFFAFLVLSTVIILSVAARGGKEIFPWANLSDLKSDSSLPGQNNMAAAVASDATPAIPGNVPVTAPPGEAALPKDIIRDEIMFETNSTDISSKFYSVIDKAADVLLGNPELIVKLEGHTDSAGSELYNVDLSIRRAAAVRSELISRGILSSRIKIICFGNSSPVASNNTESERMKNRRVEIAIPLSQS